MPLHQRMMRRIKSLVASVQSVAQVDSSRVSFKLRNRMLQEDDTYESLRMGSQESVASESLTLQDSSSTSFVTLRTGHNYCHCRPQCSGHQIGGILFASDLLNRV